MSTAPVLQRSDEQLLAELGAVETQLHASWAQMLSVIAEIDSRGGGPINAEIARRIACDAEVIPVVLGSRGEPLNVGRASRTVPTAIRRAVILRDAGCAFPVCSIPARWCDIHHVVY